MSQLEELKGAIKSLRLGLRQAFVLKEQCSVIGKVLECLSQDIENNVDLYKEGDKMTFTITVFLHRFLRFVRKNLKVTETFPVGLGDLRRARSLANINSIRKQLGMFRSELEVLFLTSAMHDRIGPNAAAIFSGGSAEMFVRDSENLQLQFKRIFENLVKAYPNDQGIQRVINDYVNNLPSKATLEDYNSHDLRRFSYDAEWKLLGTTGTSQTPFSKLNFLDDMNKPFREGKFGKVYLGTLGGPLQVCIQKVAKEQLEILSSEGRLELYFNLKTGYAKSHENLIKVVGVTLHQGSLYISMEKVDLSLKDLLHGHGSQTYRLFSAADVLAVFLSLSKALEFLHKDGIIHGDVRPENIYFNRKTISRGGENISEGFVKLGMFSYGLNLKELHWSTWTEEAMPYQAPEVLSEKSFSSASDTYSLAICLWEITQENRTPFDDFDRSEKDLVEHVKNNGRPEFSPDKREPNWLIDLANISWSQDPWHRPSASRLRLLFEQIISKKNIDDHKIKGFISKTLKRRKDETKRLKDKIGLMNNEPVNYERESAGFNGTKGSVMSGSGHPNSFTGSRPLPPLAGGVPESPARATPRVLPPLNVVVGDMQTPMQTPMQASMQTPMQTPMQTQQSTMGRLLPPLNGGPPRTPAFPDPYNAQGGATLHRLNTLDRLNDEVDRKNEAEKTKAVTMNPSLAQGSVGPDGISAEQMKRELTTFYAEHDKDMLSQLDPVVQYYMQHGLSELNPRLIESFGVGLPRFESKQGLPMPVAPMPAGPMPNLNLAPAPSDQGSKQRGSVFTMFRRKKTQTMTPAQNQPGFDQQQYYDNNAPPPTPQRDFDGEDNGPPLPRRDFAPPGL